MVLRVGKMVFVSIENGVVSLYSLGKPRFGIQNKPSGFVGFFVVLVVPDFKGIPLEAGAPKNDQNPCKTDTQTTGSDINIGGSAGGPLPPKPNHETRKPQNSKNTRAMIRPRGPGADPPIFMSDPVADFPLVPLNLEWNEKTRKLCYFFHFFRFFGFRRHRPLQPQAADRERTAHVVLMVHWLAAAGPWPSMAQ